MNIYKLFLIIALTISNFVFLQKSIANSKVSYLIDEDKNECVFVGGNQKILLASGKERTYFFFPCFGFEATYEVNTPNKKYFISELLLAPTSRNNALFLRAIEKVGNKFKDDTDLSYFLISCISLKKGGNRQLISFLLKNTNNYKKMCNTENGYITLDKKTFLYDYDKKNNKFLIRKSYLVKGDKISVSDYLFQDGILWVLANYKDTTKKWILVDF